MDNVFVGTVRQKYEDQERELAGIEVSTVYKGHVPKWMVSNTRKAGFDWTRVEIGHSYLVFSEAGPPSLDGCDALDVAWPQTSASLALLPRSHAARA